nr:hypothetical protein [Marinicella sp. W31]MDC2877916.1 hypothetical protein [Marinicella sp. W31]
MAELKLRKVGKSYGTLSVMHDLNLEIHDGEFWFSSARRAAENRRFCA